jgi:hypothetical protein
MRKAWPPFSNRLLLCQCVQTALFNGTEVVPRAIQIEIYLCDDISLDAERPYDLQHTSRGSPRYSSDAREEVQYQQFHAIS